MSRDIPGKRIGLTFNESERSAIKRAAGDGRVTTWCKQAVLDRVKTEEMLSSEMHLDELLALCRAGRPLIASASVYPLLTRLKAKWSGGEE